MFSLCWSMLFDPNRTETEHRMEHSDLIVNKLTESIRRVNKSILEASAETVMNLPDLRSVPNSIKSGWLKEDDLTTSFVQEFGKLSSNKTADGSDEKQELSTVVKELTERKEFIKRELEKILDEQILLETTISNAVTNLSKIPKSDKPILFF